MSEAASEVSSVYSHAGNKLEEHSVTKALQSTQTPLGHHTILLPSTTEDARIQILLHFSTIFVTFCERLIIVFNAR
mgnify:CR=1 FL=1